VSQTISLANAAQRLADIEAGKAHGKIVVDLALRVTGPGRTAVGRHRDARNPLNCGRAR